MAKKLIFVYGTLCANKGNHHYIKHKTTNYLGEAESPAGFTLYAGGFPIVERDGDVAVKGEVYEVNSDDVLKNVYSLEGYTGTPTKDGGDNWYDVETFKTPYGEVEMFVQEKGQSGREKAIASGDWRKDNY